MSQSIADEELIILAVRKVISTRSHVNSQRELADLVLEEMRRENPDVHASASRIRRIAVTAGIIKLDIEYRESEQTKLPDRCPVCGSGMLPVYNTTLDGKVTEIKRNCSMCPYSIGKKMQVPGRYSFARHSVRDRSAEDLRIRKLKKAASFLKSASRLIGEAVDGTNFPQRQEYSKKMISEILNSREMTGSIPNLMADIRGEGHSDPLWTKPLSSPKYPDRKDI